MKQAQILDQIIFVGGPPRSGTTFAVKSLNLHPAFVAAIDDHVYECWGLYYYRKRCGLIHELRSRSVSRGGACRILADHLFKNGCLTGAAFSEKLKNMPPVASNSFFDPDVPRSVKDNGLQRYAVPLEQFSGDWRLCLKSPEVSFVLPELATMFPQAMFVLVYRPIQEIAESMYRLGSTVKRFPVYHKRWMEEKNETGDLIPPPGVPDEWNALWQIASDFQRCVIYAASYFKGILQGLSGIHPARYFVYNHHDLQKHSHEVFGSMARFLAVDASGFQTSEKQVVTGASLIPSQQVIEYAAIEQELALNQLMHQLDSLCGKAGGSDRGTG